MMTILREIVSMFGFLDCNFSEKWIFIFFQDSAWSSRFPLALGSFFREFVISPLANVAYMRHNVRELDLSPYKRRIRR